jgi:uncharacterized protein YjiS (DUF1127 family)
MTTRVVPVGMSFAGLRIGNIALWLQERGKARIAQWRDRARSRRDLMALDGRELWDLRLTRCDAMKEAGKPFWKE